MTNNLEQVSQVARLAAQRKNWPQVMTCAREILSRRRDSAEGYFLLGLAERAGHREEQAIRAFSRAIKLDDSRYDAAVELASQYMRSNSCGQAVAVIREFESKIADSPRYLDVAATIYTDAGLPERGWPLYHRANTLQPNVDSLIARLAACSVYVGKIDEAREMYRVLLQRSPHHQRNHYEFSRLSTASDSSHIEQIKRFVESGKDVPEKNIYAYYALGKELEDLQRWEESFEYYEKAGNAARSSSSYDVDSDIRAIDKTIEVCTADWLAARPSGQNQRLVHKVPVFIVGLPRSGTTLVERILSSHSQVESTGESFFIQEAVKNVSRVSTNASMNAAIIAAASTKDSHRITRSYIGSIEYKFGDKPMFIEKFPENFLYLGFIAKAFPDARIIHVKRRPMDVCFALYKQSFFRYAYSLSDLGAYYLAYERLQSHWHTVLGERLIEVQYELLVNDQDKQTRRLLDSVGLPFEVACLNFQNNEGASNTASTVQIREKMHNRSVDRWKRFSAQLEPLKNRLENAGIDLA